MFEPSYLQLVESAELDKRIEILYKILESCELCARKCRVNRLAGEKGYCKSGKELIISSYGPHFGEEAPLVGTGGRLIVQSRCGIHPAGQGAGERNRRTWRGARRGLRAGKGFRPGLEDGRADSGQEPQGHGLSLILDQDQAAIFCKVKYIILPYAKETIYAFRILSKRNQGPSAIPWNLG